MLSVDRLKYRFSEKLGLDWLNSNLKRLLTIYWAFIFANLLSSIFVNTFIFAMDGSLRSVVTYNLFVYISITALCFLQGHLSKKFSSRLTFQIGIFLYAAFYIVLLLVRENIGRYLALAGIVYGGGAAFLFISFNILSLNYSLENQRSIFLGVQGIITSFSTLVVPLISGFILDAIMGFWGYILIFSISIVFFILALILTKDLDKIEEKGSYKVVGFIRYVLSDHNTKNVFLGEFTRGIREAAIGFMLISLLYAKVKSNGAVGSYNMVNGILQLMGYYILTKRLNFTNAKKIYTVGCIAYATATAFLLFDVNVITIFLVGMISAFFISFSANASTIMFYHLLEGMPSGQENRSEALGLREFIVNFGRSLGVLFLFFMPDSIHSFAVGLNLVSLTQLVSLYFYSKVKFQ